MKNRLHKTTERTYIPGSPGVAASPGGYTYTYREVVETSEDYQFIPPSQTTGVGDSLGESLGDIGTQWYLGVWATTRRTRRVPVPKYVPPTPGTASTPAKTLLDYRLGWNASARSIASMTGDVEARFKVPAGVVGVVVGLNDADVGSGYTDIDHGLYVRTGTAQVMERGALRGAPVTHAAGVEYRIVRNGEQVTYFKGNDLIYTSEAESLGVAHLKASLFSGGDEVFDPVLAPMTSVHAVAEPFATHIPDSVYVFAQPFDATGGVQSKVNAVAEPFYAVGSDRPYGSVEVKAEAFSAAGDGGLIVPGYGIVDSVSTPFTSSAIGFTGGIGGSDLTSEPFEGYGADRPYGFISARASPFVALGYAYEGLGNATLFGAVENTDIWSARSAVFAVVSSTGQVTAAFLVSTEYNASIISEAQAQATFAASMNMVALLMSVAQANTLTPLDERRAEGWVVNVENAGSTRYEGYGFNSFAKIDGRYYGCREDGVYMLEGDDDAGVPISAMVSFGKQDFGGSVLKRVSNAYIGASSTGKLYLRTIVEGAEYTYVARDSNEHMQTQRIDLGKGLRANWFEFELYNAGGDDFELASVEFVAVPTNRRI